MGAEGPAGEDALCHVAGQRVASGRHQEGRPPTARMGAAQEKEIARALGDGHGGEEREQPGRRDGPEPERRQRATDGEAGDEGESGQGERGGAQPAGRRDRHPRPPGLGGGRAGEGGPGGEREIEERDGGPGMGQVAPALAGRLGEAAGEAAGLVEIAAEEDQGAEDAVGEDGERDGERRDGEPAGGRQDQERPDGQRHEGVGQQDVAAVDKDGVGEAEGGEGRDAAEMAPREERGRLPLPAPADGPAEQEGEEREGLADKEPGDEQLRQPVVPAGRGREVARRDPHLGQVHAADADEGDAPDQVDEAIAPVDRAHPRATRSARPARISQSRPVTRSTERATEGESSRGRRAPASAA